MTCYALIPALLLAVLAGPVAADNDSTSRERFELFTDCSPIPVVIEQLNEDAKRIGLTHESLFAAAESRLRAARLYPLERFLFVGGDSPAPFLYVNVNVVGSAFSVDIYLKKFLWDRSSELSYSATTWESGSTGTHGGNGNYVVSWLQQHLDTFMAAYLRVNEEACR